MNKLGIWLIAIATAFVIGVLSANPVVDAVGGWKGAFDGLDTRITALETATTVELYTVSFTKDTSPPQSVELNCNSGDTVVSGYVIFPEGDTAEVNTVAINDGEGMIIGQSGATSLVVVTFQIICAKGSLP